MGIETNVLQIITKHPSSILINIKHLTSLKPTPEHRPFAPQKDMNNLPTINFQFLCFKATENIWKYRNPPGPYLKDESATDFVRMIHPPKNNINSEKRWLEDDPFLWPWQDFRGKLAVNFLQRSLYYQPKHQNNALLQKKSLKLLCIVRSPQNQWLNDPCPEVYLFPSPNFWNPRHICVLCASSTVKLLLLERISRERLSESNLPWRIYIYMRGFLKTIPNFTHLSLGIQTPP